MRLFIGIEFPEPVIAALSAAQAQLRADCERGRFKRWENFHLTLKFLGEVPAAGVPRLIPPLAAVAAGIGPFSVGLGRLGRFGAGVPVRTVWADVAGDLERLAALQRRVETALVPCGFPAERRPWRPHITLAQDVVPAAAAPSWSAYRLDRTPFVVNEYALILSEARDRRRVYTPLERFSLKG
jgi:2''-5'' RNA ligase